MLASLDSFLKFVGVTPWQFVLGVACLGSWWATVHPLPGQLRELNATVQSISTKVEVHGVLLRQVDDLTTEVRGMRKELSTIEGRLASHPGYNPK